ncbi:Uncharacterized protein FWK35_00026868 [Aphis craccivora]|uniref:Uncharacterized protein n=1 Tax=Aphis craccivora TaxID=307492 RepID=A0A6G0YA08_APHCR|nr:Uncharacterized protein FWK35_00026868 [Aphis craccivora]
MREDDLIKPARVAGGPVKGLRFKKKLSLSPTTETLTGPSIVFGGRRHTKKITCVAPHCHIIDNLIEKNGKDLNRRAHNKLVAEVAVSSSFEDFN